MGIFLNSSVPYAIYREILSDPYFVDKSSLIDELIPHFSLLQTQTQTAQTPYLTAYRLRHPKTMPGICTSIL